MKNKVLKHWLYAVAAAVTLIPFSASAADTPPPLAEAWTFTVKPADMPAFMDAVKAHGEFRASKGDPRSWQVYTPVLGDDLNRVAIRNCCFNWSDKDAYEDWEISNPEVLDHWMENGQKFVTGMSHSFSTIDWRNSHWKAEHGPFRLISVTDYDIKPEKAIEFDRARDTMSQIAIEQGWATDDHVWLWASSIGGEPNQSIVIPHANYSSMARDEDSFMRFLSKKMGDDAANQLMETLLGAIESSHFQIWEHRPGLSMSTED